MHDNHQDLLFGIVADTHSPPSDRKADPRNYDHLADERLERAVRELNQIKPAFVINLGDVASRWPLTGENSDCLRQGLKIMKKLEMPFHIAPGNHDVGNKCSESSHAGKYDINLEGLEEYRSIVGPDYFSFKQNNCIFIIYNCYLFGSGLPDERKQNDFLEDTLSQNSRKRIFMFAHCPPFIVHPDEPGPGNYDSMDKPYRNQFIKLINSHSVEAVFTGHTHQPFFNLLGSVPHYVVASTSFPRSFYNGRLEAVNGNAFENEKVGYLLVRILPENSRRIVWLPLEIPRGRNVSTDHVVSRILQTTENNSVLGVESLHRLAERRDLPTPAGHKPSYDAWSVQWMLSYGIRDINVMWQYPPSSLELDVIRFLKQHGIRITAVLPGKMMLGLENGIENVIKRAVDAEVDRWSLRVSGMSSESIVELWSRLTDATASTGVALEISGLPVCEDAVPNPRNHQLAERAVGLHLQGLTPAFVWDREHSGATNFLSITEVEAYSEQLHKTVNKINSLWGAETLIRASVGINDESLCRGKEFFFTGREVVEARVLWLASCVHWRYGINTVFSPVKNCRSGLLDSVGNPRSLGWAFMVLATVIDQKCVCGEITGDQQGWRFNILRNESPVVQFATSTDYLEKNQIDKNHDDCTCVDLLSTAITENTEGPVLYGRLSEWSVLSQLED